MFVLKCDVKINLLSDDKKSLYLSFDQTPSQERTDQTHDFLD